MGFDLNTLHQLSSKDKKISAVPGVEPGAAPMKMNLQSAFLQHPKKRGGSPGGRHGLDAVSVASVHPEVAVDRSIVLLRLLPLP